MTAKLPVEDGLIWFARELLTKVEEKVNFEAFWELYAQEKGAEQTMGIFTNFIGQRRRKKKNAK